MVADSERVWVWDLIQWAVFFLPKVFASWDASSSIWTQDESFGRFLCVKCWCQTLKNSGFGPIKLKIFSRGEVPGPPGVLLDASQNGSRKITEWGPCALHHWIQSSMEAILACHPAEYPTGWVAISRILHVQVCRMPTQPPWCPHQLTYFDLLQCHTKNK